MVQYTFEKHTKMPSRSAIGCFSNIPDLKKDILYNLPTMIGQWYNKDVNDGWQTESVRTIEEISLQFDPQTYFLNFQLFVEILQRAYIFQSGSIYSITSRVV